MSALPGDITGQRLLVIGGSGGVGSAIVRMAADAGAQVISASRRGGALECAPESGETVPIAMDITDGRSIIAAFSAISKVWDAIDILVLTAGETRSVPLKDLAGLDEELVEGVAAFMSRRPPRFGGGR